MDFISHIGNQIYLAIVFRPEIEPANRVHLDGFYLWRRELALEFRIQLGISGFNKPGFQVSAVTAIVCFSAACRFCPCLSVFAFCFFVFDSYPCLSCRPCLPWSKLLLRCCCVVSAYGVDRFLLNSPVPILDRAPYFQITSGGHGAEVVIGRSFHRPV